MNDLHHQFEIHELKAKLMLVIINLSEDANLTKEDATIELAKILDYLSAEIPAITFEKMVEGKR